MLEHTALHLIRGLHERTGEENLCMAGGVAFNSVMNGRIMTESPFKNYFVQPAAGDAGCSLGAALLVHHQLLKQPRKLKMEHAYYGPGFSSVECASALTKAGLQFETLPDAEMLPRVAQMLADGAIIGWFQGRMEFVPLHTWQSQFHCRPARGDMRELLNKRSNFANGSGRWHPS